jgi:hypothetical protein
MPRGRPKKIRLSDAKQPLNVIGIQYFQNKRQYKKRTQQEKEQKTIPKKRGRKAGCTKSNIILYKAEDVIDYIHRNYPLFELNKIRNKILENIKKEKTLEKKPYMLNTFNHNNISYYYDDNDFILNTAGELIGFFINDNEYKKAYLFEFDEPTYEEILTYL